MNIGLSTCGKAINDDLFKQYADNSISHMEITVSSDEYKKLDYCLIRQLAEKHNITLWSFHLPFSPFTEIDLSSKRLKNKTIRYYEELIKYASDIGIRNFIVHPSAEPILPRYRRNRMEHSKDSLFRLACIAENYGSTILVEDLPRTCLGRNSDEMLELISVHESLRVCFDTNHLLEESISEFIDKVGPKITSTHISDYDCLNERHWLPGEGVIDWHMLYKKLEDIGYTGPWLYELGFGCPTSINRERKLNCADFYRNATEIFNCNQLTVIGKLKTGLLSWKIIK